MTATNRWQFTELLQASVSSTRLLSLSLSLSLSFLSLLWLTGRWLCGNWHHYYHHKRRIDKPGRERKRKKNSMLYSFLQLCCEPYSSMITRMAPAFFLLFLIAIRSVRVRLIETAKDHANEERKPHTEQKEHRTVQRSRKSTLGWLTFELSDRCKEQMRVCRSILRKVSNQWEKQKRRERETEKERKWKISDSKCTTHLLQCAEWAS